jgi:copper chaperone NosL
MKSLNPISRILLAVASLSMIATYFMPLWQIQLWAPQYPEGLNMKIWHNKLSGSFDIINGLNHYIGMRMIKAEMFPEFNYLGILIGIFIAIGLVAALFGTRRWLMVFTGTAYLYGLVALYDFYRWGYDYGHNLDPHAAIRVPGMSYQPPVIGYKNLLNFTAYSGPDAGGWLIIGVGITATLLLVCSWFFCAAKPGGKQAVSNTTAKAAVAACGLLVLSALTSCTAGPEPIRYGKDDCSYCKMTCTYKRFGSEIVTKKGKTYKFDDLVCMVKFLQAGSVPDDQVARLISTDFNHPGTFVDVKKAFFLKGDAFKSPMRGDVATFSTPADRDGVKSQAGGIAMDWNETSKSF